LKSKERLRAAVLFFRFWQKIYNDVIFHVAYHPLSNNISGLNWVDFKHCLIQLELARVIAMARKNHSWTSLCWEVGIIWQGNYEKVSCGVPETVECFGFS